jgi:glycosyltransferase involved in cell wall biosynthesis
MTECFPEDSWRSKIVERFQQTKEIFNYASGVVSATRFLKMMFENQGYYPEIAIIRFGKDYRSIRKKDKQYLPDSKITIGYLSSMNPHKGAHILLNTFMKVNPENIRIKIYGDPSASPHYFKILQNIVKGHPNIEFCGGYQYEDMPEIFDGIDMIAVPSVWWENSPLVLLRAMAHNVPAVVSDLGGLTEIVTNGHDSFTFTVDDAGLETGTSTDLSEIIRKIDKDPQILNELKANITSPPRIEEEAFEYECLYSEELQKTLNKQ